MHYVIGLFINDDDRDVILGVYKKEICTNCILKKQALKINAIGKYDEMFLF